MSNPAPSDSVNTVAKNIEQNYSKGDRSSKCILNEVNTILKGDTQNGSLNKSQYQTDLTALNNKLHSDNVLPGIDIIDQGSSDAALRGTGQTAKSPDGKDSLITKSHGTTFTYDKNGDVQSFTKGDDTYKYDKTAGGFQEYVNGKKTGSVVDEEVSMGKNGTETVTNADGSSTTTAAWGGQIDRNANGDMTKETRGDDTKTFTYKDGQLQSMTDTPKGKAAVTYTKDSNGNFYASTDTSKKDPVDISLEPKDSKGNPETGVVQVTDQKTKSYTDYRLGGTATNWNKDNELTSIDYHNGNKASDIKYDSNGDISGMTMTTKDGTATKISSDNGMVTVGNGKAVKGTISANEAGGIDVTQTGDGSDASYKQVHFGLAGNQVDSIKAGGKVVPETVINSNGKTNSFKYDSSGNLTSVDAYGMNLTMKNGEWMQNGKAADGTPSVSADGSFSYTKSDGTYTTWGANGTQISGTPETTAESTTTTTATTPTDSTTTTSTPAS